MFKGIHGLFHHHKVQAIYCAVNTFKKYLQGRILCGVYHVRRLKKAQLRTPIGNVTTYDELKNTFQQYNVESDNVLPIISDTAIPQSLVGLNCYKCSPVHNCTCPKYMCTFIIL